MDFTQSPKFKISIVLLLLFFVVILDLLLMYLQYDNVEIRGTSGFLYERVLANQEARFFRISDPIIIFSAGFWVLFSLTYFFSKSKANKIYLLVTGLVLISTIGFATLLPLGLAADPVSISSLKDFAALIQTFGDWMLAYPPAIVWILWAFYSVIVLVYSAVKVVRNKSTIE